MNRLWLTSIVLLSLSGPRWPRLLRNAADTPATGDFPVVTFGVTSFLQYAAELHESNGYNAFDVTRGYLNIKARLSDRVQRSVHAGRAADDRRQPQSEPRAATGYASLDAQVTDDISFMFGLHEMPWLTFEESVNRYRVHRALLRGTPGIDSWTDRSRRQRQGYRRAAREVHVGVYNGEGYGRAEIDKYKSIDGRVTFRPFSRGQRCRQREHLGVLSVRLVRERPPAQRRDRDGQLRGAPCRRHGAISVGH